MDTPLQRARKLSKELGQPGVKALQLAAKKAGIPVTKAEVEKIVKQQGERQIFGPLQAAEGKTVSRGPDDSWQMDLADLRNQPGMKGTKKQEDRLYKFFLVVVNTFDRVVYTRALKGKESWEVRVKLSEILMEAPARPKVISSDNGNEFLGEVSDYLQNLGIAQRFKAVGDQNALGVVDRAIQSIKQTIARMMASNASSSSDSWVDVLPRATAAYNKTPKGPLHGAAPKDVRDEPEVQFMLLQDNARKLQHNEQLKDKRVRALRDAGGAYREPLPEATSKFKRSFMPTYGDVKEVRSVKGSIVTGKDGSSINVKHIKIVPADSTSSDARFGHNEAGSERKRLAAGGIIVRLQEILQGREGALSMANASALLRERMRSEPQTYEQTLTKAKLARLVDVIRLAPEQFVLTVRRTAGAKKARASYYVALRE